jgi:hypothetical protein
MEASSMSYQTQPGTMPHRAVEHLRGLPAGHALSSAELAQVMGTDPANLAAILGPVRRHGLLTTERVDGRRIQWRLGDGTPLPQAADTDPPVQVLTRAAVSEVPRVPLFPGVAPAAPAPAPAPMTEAAPAPVSAPAPAKRAVRAAVWSSGELAIETADETFIFDKAVAREVIAFLKRVEVAA